MTDEADDSEKEHEPSQRRLEQAREKGEIARSADLITAAAFGGMTLAAMLFGAGAVQRLGQTAMVLVDQPDRFSRLFLTGGVAPAGGLLADLGVAVAPFFALPALAAIGAVIAQRALIFTPEKLRPKLSRISPVAGFSNRFGRAGLFEFAKSVVKLVVYSVVLAIFLRDNQDAILGTLYLTPAGAVVALLGLLTKFLFVVVVLAFVIGAGDYLWQRFEHLSRNRMSRKEMLDEHKDSEGDPHTKAQRRQRGMDIATNRMLKDVAKADVIIVNPTHYAVALRWDRGSGQAPVCVAKGVDEIAARIRERAAEAGVPIHRDPPTARALHATVEIGMAIRPEHYRRVAAAIRFAEAMRRRARARR